MSDLQTKLTTKGENMTQDTLMTKEEQLGLDEYQYLANRTADYIHPIYPFMLLHEEAGELSAQFTKVKLRGDDRPIDMVAAKKELGDCLWAVAEIATQLGFSLESVARANLSKLEDRAARGQIKGSGDNR